MSAFGVGVLVLAALFDSGVEANRNWNDEHATSIMGLDLSRQNEIGEHSASSKTAGRVRPEAMALLSEFKQAHESKHLKASSMAQGKQQSSTKQQHMQSQFEKILRKFTAASRRHRLPGDEIRIIHAAEPSQWSNSPPAVITSDPELGQHHSLRDYIFYIGGGTGASVSGTGDSYMDQDLLRRMRYQDKAVMMLLLAAYLGSLLFSAIIAHRQVRNTSSVTFYADPRFHSMTTDSQDVESFLEAFNTPPRDAQLQVMGLMPLPLLPEYVMDAAVEWLGVRYRVAFSFALDLSPWLVPLGSGEDGPSSEWSSGVSQGDVQVLREYLANDTNDLSYVEIHKSVEWKDWEELATNIKSKIRQSGFTGVIDVRRSTKEVMGVHKNKQWSNFLHSRTTKVLMALSVIGWFFYQPYMYLRHTCVGVACRYKVDVTIGQYWPLIQDNIGARGFNYGSETPRPSQSNARTSRSQRV